MSGTKAGAKKAAATNKEKYGENFYREIGRKGGQNGHTGGFAYNHELAVRAGAIGGKKSRRGPAKNKRVKIDEMWSVWMQNKKKTSKLQQFKLYFEKLD